MIHLRSKILSFFKLLKITYASWMEREPLNNSVIIAYYTIFSLPGLLVIIINLAGWWFGHEAVTHQVSGQISGMVGQDTAKDIETMIAGANQAKGTVLSTVLSMGTLLFGATGVFYQLQQVVNKMWEVKPKPKVKILKLLKDRLFSFGLILVVGFLLLVSLVLSAALSALSSWVTAFLPQSLMVLFQLLDVLISIGMVALLFAAIFKFLPDADVRWRHVWPGALLTSLLFVVAKFGLGLYFGHTNPGSPYGAAGTVILILLWVSYAGLIVLFGAEFTQTYANTQGGYIGPKAHAVATGPNTAAEKQGT